MNDWHPTMNLRWVDRPEFGYLGSVDGSAHYGRKSKLILQQEWRRLLADKRIPEYAWEWASEWRDIPLNNADGTSPETPK